MAAAYEVTNVTEEQVDDPSGSGDLIDVFQITYKLADRPGTFTINIPESPDPVTAAFNAISTKVAEIEAIYAASSS